MRPAERCVQGLVVELDEGVLHAANAEYAQERPRSATEADLEALSHDWRPLPLTIQGRR